MMVTTTTTTTTTMVMMMMMMLTTTTTMMIMIKTYNTTTTTTPTHHHLGPRRQIEGSSTGGRSGEVEPQREEVRGQSAVRSQIGGGGVAHSHVLVGVVDEDAGHDPVHAC